VRILHLDSGREMRGGQWQVLRLHQGLTVRSGTGTTTNLVAVGTPIRFNGERAYNGHLSTVVGQDNDTVLTASTPPEPAQ